MPIEIRFIPSLANSLNLLLSEDVGLASIVISMFLSSFVMLAISFRIASNIKGVANDGVPPPKKMLVITLFFNIFSKYLISFM